MDDTSMNEARYMDPLADVGDVMHTPGPWQFIDNVVQPTSRKKYDGCNICRVTIPHDGLAAEWLANTRLIAAAPDLLASLKVMVERAIPFTAHWKDDASIVAAHAAIAKAEGK